MPNHVDPNSEHMDPNLSSSLPAFKMPSFSPPPFSVPGKTQTGQNGSKLQSPLALGAPTKKAGMGDSSGSNWTREHDEPDPPNQSDGPSDPVNTSSPFSFGGYQPMEDGSLKIFVAKALPPPYNEWWNQIFTYQSQPLTDAQKQQLATDASNKMSIEQALSSLHLTWTFKKAENNLLKVPVNMNQFRKWFPREYEKVMYQIALGIAMQTQQQMQQAGNELKKAMAKMGGT